MWPIRAAWLVVAAGSVAQATLQIIPGATWTATNTGKHVQAHGAGITQVGSTYYMIGEDKTDGSAFQNINCYSSTNLVEWAFEGALLSRTSAAGDLGPNRVVERPKVVFNAAANRYVMYLHIDSSNYGDAKVGVATSDTVCGKYTYLRSFRPLGFESRDIGLFKDDDGAAYLLTEDRPNGLRIDALSNDYLDVTRNVFLWNENIESPAILKKNGYYFMFGSRLTGWDANDNVYSYATSLAGPWSSWRTFAPAGSKTFQSQTSFVLPLGDTAVYMGDRWVPDNLMRSTYVWLPLTIAGTTVSMTNRVNWTPNVAQGTWAPGPAETTPEAETGVLAGGARTLSCSGCSGGTAVGYLGGPSGGAVTINGISSQASTRSTIRIKHANGDRAQRFARVAVNGGAPQTLAFLPSDDGNSPATSVLHAALNQGAANTIEIRGLGDGSYGPDVDRLMVPNN